MGAMRLRHNLSLEKEVDLRLTESTILPTGKWWLGFLVEAPKHFFETVVLNVVDPEV